MMKTHRKKMMSRSSKKIKVRAKIESIATRSTKEHLKLTKINYFLEKKDRIKTGWSIKCLSTSSVKFKQWFKPLELLDI